MKSYTCRNFHLPTKNRSFLVVTSQWTSNNLSYMEKLDIAIAHLMIPSLSVCGFITTWAFSAGLTNFIRSDISRRGKSLLRQIVRTVVERFFVFQLVLVF